MKLNRTLSSLRDKAAILCAALPLLAGCSSRYDEDLAVNKMPVSQMQATNFLALNADKPGTPVDVQRYVVPGKFTIVAYLSPYDAKSVDIEPRLNLLTQMRQDLAVRTVNINRPEIRSVDWQSPVLQDAEIRTLPYFRIYEPSQALRAHGRPAYEQIMQWVQPAPATY